MSPQPTRRHSHCHCNLPDCFPCKERIRAHKYYQEHREERLRKNREYRAKRKAGKVKPGSTFTEPSDQDLDRKAAEWLSRMA